MPKTLTRAELTSARRIKETGSQNGLPFWEIFGED